MRGLHEAIPKAETMQAENGKENGKPNKGISGEKQCIEGNVSVSIRCVHAYL
jgi:hypothetical protein